jgi:hypothetical protein
MQPNNSNSNDHYGVVELIGGLKSLEIGGQELYVDHFCFPCPNAITTKSIASMTHGGSS